MILEGAACFSSLSDCQPISLQYAAARLRAEGCRPGLGPGVWLSPVTQRSAATGGQSVSVVRAQGQEMPQNQSWKPDTEYKSSCLVMGDKQECISVRFPPLIKVLLSCRLWAVSRRSCPRPQPRLRSVWSRIRPGLALAATALGTLAITLHCARTFSFLQTWSTLLLSMVFNLNIKP